MNHEAPMRPAGYGMSETADAMNRRKRKYHVTAESTGKHLVMAELLRRGFEAELAGPSYEKHHMLVWARDSSTETHSNQDRAFAAMVRAPCEFRQAC